MEFINTVWPAPAKLNLFLHITGRRQDGYHLLQTVFQFINLTDTIKFTPLDTDTVTLKMRDNTGPAGNQWDWYTEIAALPAEKNLAVKAAIMLKTHTACTQGIEIQINKAIPTGGGLGGGSSNAATTLVALNDIWQTQLSTDELIRLGLKLGADIPIFIHAHAAWAEGIGEKLTPIAPEECYYLVIYPGCHVDTTTLFNAEDLTRDTPTITIQKFLQQGGGNDFESLVLRHYSEVKKAFDWLNNYAPARLTGTGSCIFAPFLNAKKAATIKDDMPTNWQGYIVKGMNRSPLLDRLAIERNNII